MITATAYDLDCIVKSSRLAELAAILTLAARDILKPYRDRGDVALNVSIIERVASDLFCEANGGSFDADN